MCRLVVMPAYLLDIQDSICVWAVTDLRVWGGNEEMINFLSSALLQPLLSLLTRLLVSFLQCNVQADSRPTSRTHIVSLQVDPSTLKLSGEDRLEDGEDDVKQLYGRVTKSWGSLSKHFYCAFDLNVLLFIFFTTNAFISSTGRVRSCQWSAQLHMAAISLWHPAKGGLHESWDDVMSCKCRRKKKTEMTRICQIPHHVHMACTVEKQREMAAERIWSSNSLHCSVGLRLHTLAESICMYTLHLPVNIWPI